MAKRKSPTNKPASKSANKSGEKSGKSKKRSVSKPASKSSPRASGKSSSKALATGEPEGFRKVDKALWSDVAAKITAVVTQQRTKESGEVGKIILNDLFGGDIAKFKKFGAQHKTFQALAEGSKFSAGYLRYAVLIYDQLKVLRKTAGAADDVGPHLSVSVHRKLLTIKDPKQKAMVAAHIYDKGLSLEEAIVAINQARSENEDYEEKRGRPAQSSIAKGIPTLVKAMGRLLYGDTLELDGLALPGKVKVAKLSGDVLEGCSDDKIAALKVGVETLGQMTADLEQLRSALSSAIEGRESAPAG